MTPDRTGLLHDLHQTASTIPDTVAVSHSIDTSDAAAMVSIAAAAVVGTAMQLAHACEHSSPVDDSSWPAVDARGISSVAERATLFERASTRLMVTSAAARSHLAAARWDAYRAGRDLARMRGDNGEVTSTAMLHTAMAVAALRGAALRLSERLGAVADSGVQVQVVADVMGCDQGHAVALVDARGDLWRLPFVAASAFTSTRPAGDVVHPATPTLPATDVGHSTGRGRSISRRTPRGAGPGSTHP